MEERIIVVPLRKARRGTSSRFAPKAVKFLRNFIKRHMKVEEVIIGNKLNSYIWSRGIKNPPRRVEVRAVKKGNKAYVELSSLRDEDFKAFVEGKQEKIIAVKTEKKEEKVEKKEENKQDKKEETNNKEQEKKEEEKQ